MEPTAIVAILEKNGIEATEAEISAQLTDMMTSFFLDEKTATNAIFSQYSKSTGKKIIIEGSKVQAVVADIDGLKDGQWIKARMQVVKLFNNDHEKIIQSGVAGDETGSIKFTVWEGSTVPELVEGQTYLFDNIVTNKFQGSSQLNINKNSAIEVADEPVESVPETKFITGVVTKVLKNSGLIKRCPECKKPLTKGACKDHGAVQGVYDIRLMVEIDDGKKTSTVTVQKELAEVIMGMTMDSAIAIASDALDMQVIREKQVEMFEGRYLTVEVRDMQSRYLNCCAIAMGRNTLE
jgi:replication factor A1